MFSTCKLVSLQMHTQYTTFVPLFIQYIRNCYLGESNEPKMSESASQQAKPIPAMLEVGSAVEFGYPVQYGVIKRIEEDPISNKEIAKIEMVS